MSLRCLSNMALATCAVWASVGLAHAQSDMHRVVSYSFNYHECSYPINLPDQPSEHVIASRFTHEGVGCHYYHPDVYGTWVWPTEYDPAAFAGFTLAVPAGQRVAFNPEQDTLSFDVYGGASLHIAAWFPSGQSVALLDTTVAWAQGIPSRVAIAVPASASGPSVSFRISAFGSNSLGFDNVRVSYVVSQAVGVVDEAVAAPSSCAVGPTFPHPVSSTATTVLSRPFGASSRMEIHDARGRNVRRWALPGPGGESDHVRWTAEGLSAGTYVVSLVCGEVADQELVVIVPD